MWNHACRGRGEIGARCFGAKSSLVVAGSGDKPPPPSPSKLQPVGHQQKADLLISLFSYYGMMLSAAGGNSVLSSIFL